MLWFTKPTPILRVIAQEIDDAAREHLVICSDLEEAKADLLRARLRVEELEGLQSLAVDRVKRLNAAFEGAAPPPRRCPPAPPAPPRPRPPLNGANVNPDPTGPKPPPPPAPPISPLYPKPNNVEKF